MRQKSSVRKKVKLLSWLSLISLVTLLSFFVYNSNVYIKNLREVKKIVELVDSNTSTQLKNEIIKTLTNNIESTETVYYLLLSIGIIFIILVIYLGRSIKKEISKRIHAMDWIVE